MAFVSIATMSGLLVCSICFTWIAQRAGAQAIRAPKVEYVEEIAQIPRVEQQEKIAQRQVEQIVETPKPPIVERITEVPEIQVSRGPKPCVALREPRAGSQWIAAPTQNL